jgi:hypothetical protein
MKVCRHCGQEKPAGEFPTNRRCHDGLSPWCRLCHAEATCRSRAKRAEREAPIIEARRKEAHAKWMACAAASPPDDSPGTALPPRCVPRRKALAAVHPSSARGRRAKRLALAAFYDYAIVGVRRDDGKARLPEPSHLPLPVLTATVASWVRCRATKRGTKVRLS